jgi:uncharacterized membrane protein YbhN (UPF0104 family)
LLLGWESARLAEVEKPWARAASAALVARSFPCSYAGMLGHNVVMAALLVLWGFRAQERDRAFLGVALNSTLFDRASGLVVLMALGAVAALVFPRHDFPTALLVGVVATGFGLVIGWWLCPRAVRVLPEQNGVRRLVEHDLAPLWRDHRMLARVIGVSLTFHLSQVGVQLVLARAAGIALPWSYLLVVHPLLSVMMALPLSIGGFGVREGGYLYFLTRIDVDDSVALAMSLSWWAVTVVSALLGGLVFTLTGARLPRLRPQESPSVLLAAPGVATSDLPPV